MVWMVTIRIIIIIVNESIVARCNGATLSFINNGRVVDNKIIATSLQSISSNMQNIKNESQLSIRRNESQLNGKDRSWLRYFRNRIKLNTVYITRNGFDEQFKDESMSFDGRIGLFLFTRYCGPGARIWKTFFPGERSYTDIDLCCKMHDECPNFVEKREHYSSYPGLEFRPQYFSRSVHRISFT